MKHHQDLPLASEAVRRYAIISKVCARVLMGESRLQAIELVARTDHIFAGCHARHVSPRTLYRWYAAWERDGMRGLERLQSTPSEVSKVLPKAFLEFLVIEKREDIHASIPEIIARAKQRGFLASDAHVCRTSVWRAAKRMGVTLSRRKGAKTRDSRRFAFPHRMQMVLCDGKHFRAGPDRKKRVALFFIDDATRYVLHVVVGTSESAALFHRGLFECIARWGLMEVIYFDNGPGFIALSTYEVASKLGVLPINGEAGYPEGRGKVERFNRTVQADVLRGLDGRPGLDASCAGLELRISHYLRDVYAHRPHAALGGETPWQRFSADSKQLRIPQDRADLRSKFAVWLSRRVSSDHVVSFESVLYETPRGYAGIKLQLRLGTLDGTISMLHRGELIELKPVDLVANARTPRARDQQDDATATHKAPTTSAELRFQRDFGSVVDLDGGLTRPLSPDDEPSQDDDQ